MLIQTTVASTTQTQSVDAMFTAIVVMDATAL